MVTIMKMNGSGQITIPKELRDLFGLRPDMTLEVELSKEGILIKPEQSHAGDVMKWLKQEHGDEMATLTTQQILRLVH